MSGQRLTCNSCGWTCEAEKGVTLGDAHRNCPGPAPEKTLRERFPPGSYFLTAHKAWQVTDVGSRVVVAMEYRPGWTEGPPYDLLEVVFDESDMPALQPVSQEPGKTMEETLAGLRPPQVTHEQIEAATAAGVNVVKAMEDAASREVGDKESKLPAHLINSGPDNDWVHIYNPYDVPPPVEGELFPASEIVNMTRGWNPVVRRLAQEVLLHRWWDCDQSQGPE